MLDVIYTVDTNVHSSASEVVVKYNSPKLFTT